MSAMPPLPLNSGQTAIHRIADIPPRCDASAMKYQCCYCDQSIDRSDRQALRITLSGLWGSADDSVQDMFAHSVCAGERFGANLSSMVPFDLEMFEPE